MNLNTNIKAKATSSARRSKIEHLKEREDLKGDKRQVLEQVLVSKLVKKYGQDHDKLAVQIKSQVSRLTKGTSRITESDIAALERSVQRLYLEHKNGIVMSRGSSRATIGATPTPQSSSSRKSSGPKDDVEDNAEERHNPTKIVKGSNEWVVINALQSVEHEQKELEKAAKLKKEKERQRKWLDVQQREKLDQVHVESSIKSSDYQRQVEDLKKWKAEEEEKERERLAKIEFIKTARQEQLAVLNEKSIKEAKIKRQEEELEVERCKRILREEEEEREKARVEERERMKKVLLENQQVEVRKKAEKEKETEYDIFLVEEYARKLAKEEQDRADALQSKLHRQDVIHSGMAMSTHEIIRKQALEDELKAEEYQRKKIAADDAREKSDIRKRKEEAMKCKEYLDFQKSYKERQAQKAVEEEQEFARVYQQAGEAAQKEKRLALEKVKETNKKYERQLCRQMKLQEEARAKQFAAMNPTEKQLNAKLLVKLAQDETLAKEVAQKLSPDKQRAKGKSKTMKSSIF